MPSHFVKTLVSAALCWFGSAAMLLAADAPEKPAADATAKVKIDDIVKQFNKPVDTIHFTQTPLPAAIEEIAKRFDMPLVVDDSVRKLTHMPTLTLSVNDIKVRQLLDIVGTCTGTAMWIDPPGYDGETPVRIVWTTRARREQLKEESRWKTVPVDLSERPDMALRERTDLQFADTSLADAINFFRDYHQVPMIYAGPADLAKSPITLEIKGISLRTALDLMLRPLELGFIVDAGTIQIVSAEQARQFPVTRVYTVPEWVGRDVDAKELQNAFRMAAGVVLPDPHPSVTWLHGCVVVTAAEEQHGRIEQFVARLRSAVQTLAPSATNPPHAPGELPAN